jgi:phage baseplate assembly protein W
MSNIVGYTTVDQQNGSLRLQGLELAKQDLMNHFKIRKGEKWTNPNFGSNLLNYIFQPLDDNTTEAINDEVYEIVSYDPRFKLASNDIIVDQDAHSVTVTVKLMYLPTTTATDLQIKFDSESTEQAEF